MIDPQVDGQIYGEPLYLPNIAVVLRGHEQDVVKTLAGDGSHPDRRLDIQELSFTPRGLRGEFKLICGPPCLTVTYFN